MQLHSHSAEETEKHAADLLKKHPETKVWLLYGNLAAGKTQFVKGIAKALGREPRSVKSPTFIYLSEYPEFVHYDLYRLTQMDADLMEQLEEHLRGDRPVFIEWPELVEEKLSAPMLRLRFEHAGGDERRIEVLED